jgi:MFS family permease
VASVLTPRVTVPASMRAEFFLVAPSLVATWALGGFHLSLGPSIVGTLFGLHGAVLSGLDIFALFIAGALGAFLVRSAPPIRTMTLGAGVLAAGLALNLAALGTEIAPLYFAGSAVSGLGWGATFFGAMKVIGAITPPAERGGVFATTFVLSYLAFSVPAVIGGLAVHQFGLRPTAVGYGILVIVLVLGSSIGLTVRSRRDARLRAH